ncbi:XVIPCD domain-containing protein, partial [Frateuria defendens]|uniref:XVIPCD domain-containing protein n=1 Tax=Frateuria defendens TaxID=2219559 RepID=UPI0012931088
MLKNLQDTLNGSPVLAEEIKRAVTMTDPLNAQHRVLESFAFTAPGSGVGGSFSASSHTMNLVSDSLTKTPATPSTMGFEINDLTFVIGHEIQHGFNAQTAEKARAAFTNDVRALAATPGPVHDFTALERHIQSGREDEAKAEIAGWNALRSGVQQRHHGAVTLSDIQQAARHRADDFVLATNGTLVPRPNVHLNADLSMSPTPANVAAMGQNYFDRPTAGHLQPGDTRQAMALAHSGVSDYPNYYAGWAIATIGLEEQIAAHRHGVQPQVQINMAHAGLYEDMMEKAGLNLAPSKQSIPYLDNSMQPAVPHRFDHTADGPNQYQYVPVAPARLDDPAHPDHALYNQVRSQVIDLDRSVGREPDTRSNQLAAALAVEARAAGMHSVDRIAFNGDASKLWGVQDWPGIKGFHMHSVHVDTVQGLNMSMEQSGAKWPDAMQQSSLHNP